MLRLGESFENRALHIDARFFRRIAKVGLQQLSHVHTGRYAERIQDDLDRLAIRQDKAYRPQEQVLRQRPLFPWRPAILSPTCSLRLVAT